MSGVSNLFENLMHYNDVNSKSNRIDENNSTLLNLTVELPPDTEEMSPEDVKVDVGIMSVDRDGVEGTQDPDTSTEDEINVEDSEDETQDVTPEDEESSTDDKEPEKEESLNLRLESIRKKRLEAKRLKENSKNMKEAAAPAIAAGVIYAVDNWDTLKDMILTVQSVSKDLFDKLMVIYDYLKAKQVDIKEAAKEIGDMIVANESITTNVDEKSEGFGVIGGIKKVLGMESCEDDSCKTEESKDVETAKANIRKRVTNVSECNKDNVKKESLMHLDTKSLNKLFTEFVKENYKNIDKVVITKAILENNSLTINGKIVDLTGKTEKISFTNKGFNASKLEGKRFMMDFKDNSNTFSIIKESLRQPFTFIATLRNGILAFESLQYSFKTMNESNKVTISGKCTLKEGLFDGKTKDWVRKEFNKFGNGDITTAMTDDGLGFTAETKNKEALEKQLTSAGYKESNGDYYRVDGKQKMYVSFKMSGSLTNDNQTYIARFSARKEDIKQIKESTLTEDANQVKKFNEIVDKIKAAKTPEDLSACKDEMDDSNIGDTLLSAAQMVWDDISSRINASTKK